MNKWIEASGPEDDYLYQCPDCEFIIVLFEGSPLNNQYYYCPKCGNKNAGLE